jgi:hypothetical protein
MRNEQAAMKKPAPKKDAGTSTPANQVLRVQPRVHSPVLDKALDVRANEIRFETPTISETALYDAYNRMRPSSLQAESWTISPEMTPQQVLELLESASPRMIKAIYRVLAGHFHPDRNPNRIAWADQMMKLINRAYEHLEHKT